MIYSIYEAESAFIINGGIWMFWAVWCSLGLLSHPMTTAGSKPAGFKDPFCGGGTQRVSSSRTGSVSVEKGYKTLLNAITISEDNSVHRLSPSHRSSSDLGLIYKYLNRRRCENWGPMLHANQHVLFVDQNIKTDKHWCLLARVGFLTLIVLSKHAGNGFDSAALPSAWAPLKLPHS